ncbi:MAG: hypothetical protein EBS42_17100 [Caulobacteraceae bacterium]|nr:hypothetical protein [Caulobacteraceae bacterium]
MGERDAAGISYSVAAFNGAQASQFLRGNNALVAAEVAAAEPSLLVYAFGTNEAWGVAGQTDGLPPERRAAGIQRGAEGVTASLRKWIKLTRGAAQDADCLVILPPDATRNPKEVRACLEAATTPAEVEQCNVSEPAVAAVSVAFKAMAESEGCATWDIATAMGGTGSMWEWMAAVPTRGQADGVHLTGTGYGLVGARLASDLLEGPVPDRIEVILAGDICYEQPLAGRVLAWLTRARAEGRTVLIGDPMRTYFPREGLIKLAEYQVPTTRELEDFEVKRTSVWAFP